MNGTRNRKLSKFSSWGSIISAFLASVCCIGPIVFALLGIGGAGFAMGLEKYRPVFIGVAVIFLGIAFYYTYRKREAGCELDSVCVAPKDGRFNKLMLWVAAALAGFFIAFPYLVGWLFG